MTWEVPTLPFSFPAAVKAFWRHPAGLCATLGVALVIIGDKYPLSNFPMYSNLGKIEDTSADLMLITNEADRPLPMSKLFDVGSAQGKKRFESILQKVAGTKEYEDAPPDKRRAAGEAFLAKLWEARDEDDVESFNPREFRLKIRTVAMRHGVFSDTTTEIATMTVPQPQPKKPAP